MGCNASQVKHNSSAAYSAKSPAIDCLSQDVKAKIKKILQKDNHYELAIFIKQSNLKLNSQVSEGGLKWMITHFCCRYDASKCMQYILKSYFISNAATFVQYVNAPTSTGSTCLHLCGFWKGQNCFNILYYYGGLFLNALDKNNSSPLDVAIQNKTNKMADVLARYREYNMNFTLVESERLVSDNSIAADPKKSSKEIQENLKKKIQDQGQSQLSEGQKRLIEQKKKLEQELAKIKQEKLRKQIEAEAQKAEVMKRDASSQKEALQKQKQAKIAKDKIQEAMKAERQKYKAEAKAKQDQLKRLKDQLKKLEESRVNQEMMEQQRKAEQFAKEKEQELRKKKQQQEEEVQQIKQQGLDQKQNQEHEKRKKNSNNKPKNLKRQTTIALPQQIIDKYQKAKQDKQFLDDQFPPDNTSLGEQSPDQQYRALQQRIIWLKPTDIFPEQPFQVFDTIQADDINQGELGVCYMLATISAIARVPKNIEKMFIVYDAEIGFYVFKFYIHGVPTFIAIDDYIPCDSNTYFPVFTQPAGNQLWVMLLQKCWAKAIGTYLSAEGMCPHEMMQDLTGAPAFGGDLQDMGNNQNIAENLNAMILYSTLGHIIVLASNPQVQLEGIVGGHAYSLLKTYKIGNQYIFQIRNPWGRFEWKGEYSQHSDKLTPQIKKQINFNQQQDGLFYMSQNELLGIFMYYSVNILFDTHQYSYVQFNSTNGQDVYYKFSMKKKCIGNIKLTQPFNRMIQDPQYQYAPVIFEVGKIQKNGVSYLAQGNKDTVYGAKTIHAFDQTCYELTPGDYIVRIRMFWPKQQTYNSAVLSTYLAQEVTFEQIDQQTGTQYLSKMLAYAAKSNQSLPANDGGSYKLGITKGQYVFVGQTTSPGDWIAQFSFQNCQLQGAELELGKVDDMTIQVPVKKGEPGVGTATIYSQIISGIMGYIDVQFIKQ